MMATKGRIEPSRRDVEKARELKAALNSAEGRAGGERVTVAGVELSRGARVALEKVLDEFAEGNAVLVEGSAGVSELTTTEAASELGMSRPTLIGLLDRGELRYRMVGTHRRIAREEVERYRTTMHRGPEAPSRAERAAALRKMAETSSDAGEGY